MRRLGSALLLAVVSVLGAGVGGVRVAHAEVWPTTIARVERDLGSEDPTVRRLAAARLVDLPPSRVRQMLPRVLADSDAAVRVAAGGAAIRLGIDATPQAELWLSDAEPGVRQVAARMLGVGAPSSTAVTALARTLSDPVPAVRLEAARALANAPAEDGARALLNHVDDAQEAFVLAVIDSLASLRSPSAIVPLVGKITDPRVNVRRAVVRTLGEFEGAPQVTMPLVMALADSDPEVRRLAIDSAVSAYVFDAMPALEERVRRDRDVDVQAAALGGLLALAARAPEGAPRSRAAALAVECLSHERQELRSEALAALAAAPQVASAELGDCLTNSRGEVVGLCALALAHLRDEKNAELFVAAWRQGRILAPALLDALAVQQGEQSLLLVLELLSSDAPGVRTKAGDVLGGLLQERGGDGRAVEPVVEALRKVSSASDAEALIGVLGRTGAPRAVTHLLPYLDAASSEPLRLAAVRALGDIKGASVPVGVVEQLLTSEDETLRAATAIALREGSWRGTARLLLRLLSAAKLDETEGLAFALWGPVRHVSSPAEVSQLEKLIVSAEGRARDALLEALGRVEWNASAASWQRLARRGSCTALAKIAEVLGAYPQAVPILEPLTTSRCTNVVANAVWSIGYHGGEAQVEHLLPLVAHSERAIAGNAIAALAAIAARSEERGAISTLLCEQVHRATLGSNAARAANALFGLRRIGHRCGDGSEERALLKTSPTPQVRLQAAWLLHAVASAGDLDRKALRHCVRHDVDGEVASACLSPRNREQAPSATDATTIMVVPANGAQPMAAAPYALLTEHGAYRFGWTDQRGAAWLPSNTSDGVVLTLPVGQW